jgi:hypothetical protein
MDLATIYEDPAVSGGKALGTRPSGARLLAEARRTKPVVVVTKLDRLFRSVADAAQTITSFDRYGIEHNKRRFQANGAGSVQTSCHSFSTLDDVMPQLRCSFSLSLNQFLRGAAQQTISAESRLEEA